MTAPLMRFIWPAAIVALLSVQIGEEAPLRLAGAIDLPDVEGRFDHMAFDAAGQRLFVAALGNGTVEVLNLRAGTRTVTLPGFEEPQGIAFVADTQRIAVAEGGTGNVQLIDGGTYRGLRTIRLGSDADNVRYDAPARRLYVGYGRGALAAINAEDGNVLGEVKLDGHPESFQLERSGARIFVNVPTARHVAVIDRRAMKVVATWPVIAAASNYPMALDESGHRLFIGCRRPATAIVYDTATGKQTGTFAITGDTDDMFFDAARQRLYVSGGEGFIDVVQQRDPNVYARVARVPTAAGARTSLFVPDQNRLYLAVPHRGRQRSEIRIFEAH
jgi:DNA-binding beta-propeller fold protein YncE